MKIFFPGQIVPSNIEKVVTIGYQKGDPHLRFSSPVLVWRHERGWYIKPIILMGEVMKFRATCNSVIIHGSSEIEGGVTYIDCKPIIPSWLIVGGLALLLAVKVGLL